MKYTIFEDTKLYLSSNTLPKVIMHPFFSFLLMTEIYSTNDSDYGVGQICANVVASIF